MRPLSIRASLIAWFVGLAALLLCAFSATLYLGMSAALRGGVDARLETAAAGLVALCEWDDDIGGVGIELSQELADQLAAAFLGRSDEVWTWPEQRLVHRAGRPLEVPLPPASWRREADLGAGPLAAWSTTGGAGERRRLVTMLARSPQRAPDAFASEGAQPAFDVLVRVAEDLGPVEAQLGRLAWIVGVLAILSAAAVLFFGVVLSRRIVRPLKELGKAAARVRAGEAVQLPDRGAGDEVDELKSLLEDAFARLDEALQRQTRFTSDAAHELRNPIAVIQNAAEVALRRERQAQEYRLFLEDVLAASKRMAGVVEALLLLARMDAGRLKASFRTVDLAAIAAESAAAQPFGLSRVRVAAAGPVLVGGDEGLLRVLADNLLGNALRHSGPDAGVTVAVEARCSGPVLSVRDEGPGIPREALARVFDRFFRVDGPAGGDGARPDGSKTNGRGAGLGLAIVAEIARVHAAAVRLDSSTQGTTVTVSFPAERPKNRGERLPAESSRRAEISR